MTSIIKVDNIQDVCGSATISKCGTTITIGASGDTVTLAAGASQSGFGRTGTVNWDTTAKTTTVTAVSGNGYFINTTSGGVTVNLPAGTAGAIVAISDYANTAATNNIIIAPNGTDKINGTNASYYLNTTGASVTLIYIDSTRGWKDIGDATLDVTGVPPFITATGGTITTCGNYKIHTFTGPGTFTVTNAGTPAGSNTVDYLVVAGGGGSSGGGGGAGGFRESVPSPAAWTASPLANPGGALPVSATAYPITVGAGGAGKSAPTNARGTSGNNSIFSTITSTGGGGGGANPDDAGGTANSGGSGGGRGFDGNGTGGTGNTPPVSPAQGTNGGSAPAGGFGAAGGGGGATAAGSNGGGPGSPASGGNGGAGATTSISGSPTAYAGGGGGGANTSSTGTGGTGGSGGGGAGGGPNGTSGTGGTTNTGGGGGGGEYCGSGTSGGSGIVVIRYKFQ
jgi:hypothetical protein